MGTYGDCCIGTWGFMQRLLMFWLLMLWVSVISAETPHDQRPPL